MRFRCANRISIFFAFASRDPKALGASKRPGDVAGVLMNVARDLAKGNLRATLCFEFAAIAVALSSQIDQCSSAIHECPRRRQGLARGTMVDVRWSEVAAREGAIIPLRLIEHEMWAAISFSSTSQSSIGAAP